MKKDQNFIFMSDLFHSLYSSEPAVLFLLVPEAGTTSIFYPNSLSFFLFFSYMVRHCVE